MLAKACSGMPSCPRQVRTARVLRELDAGSVVLPFPMSEHLLARHTYQLRTRPHVVHRRQTQTFVTWLEDQAKKTQTEIDALVARRT
ncbi:MAG: hypothetical protein V4516_11205 [Pseudomonadota bacterium]